MRYYSFALCCSISFAFCADDQNGNQQVLQNCKELAEQGGIVADLDPNDFAVLQWFIHDQDSSARTVFEALSSNEDKRNLR